MLPVCTRALAAPLVAGHQDDGRSSVGDKRNRKAHASDRTAMAHPYRFETACDFLIRRAEDEAPYQTPQVSD